MHDVFVVRPDGSEEKQISDDWNVNRLSVGRWAPGAPSLAYVGEEGLMVTDVEQNATRVLVAVDSPLEVVDFAWDPTGHRLAVLFAREVRLYDLQGKVLATWARPERRTGAFRALDWSRTGVLATFLTGGVRAIFVKGRKCHTTTKGAAIYATTDTDRLQGWHLLCNFDGAFERRSLRWSPDGSRMLFVASNSPITRQIWLVDADGTDLRPLHPDLSSWESHASWSPDGKMIAYQGPDFSSGFEHEHVYVAALDGSPPRDLTPQGARACWPTWSADGTKLTFAVNTDGHWRIYVVDVDTGEGTRLTDGPGDDMHPVWSRRWQ